MTPGSTRSSASPSPDSCVDPEGPGPSAITDAKTTMTLTWGWALYVVVPFLLFVAVLVGVLAVVRRRGR